MIKTIKINNFKSVQNLEINLGRFNVFIGENGCGKTSILEAIAFGSAAAANKLDNEFLSSRGIRVANPIFMRSLFDLENGKLPISITFQLKDDQIFNYILNNKNEEFSKWEINIPHELELSEIFKKHYLNISIKLEENILNKSFANNTIEINKEEFQNFLNTVLKITPVQEINRYLIYSPENSSLRNFETEGQILPLGIKGDGLFRLLKSFDEAKLNELKDYLKMIDWFDDFRVKEDPLNERKIFIHDRYVDSELEYFDQQSSNEGFLFLLFYLSLFISENTPQFFAIDNIEASLNPKLCIELVKTLNKIAVKSNKQVITTTHNPAILDGMDLRDENQRLFVIRRNVNGHTIAERIFDKSSIPGNKNIKLSEAFLSGFLGGLPNNF